VELKQPTVQNEAKLNIPENGEITIGTVKYEYESFRVDIDKTTGEYTYTFDLKEPIRAYAEDEISSVGLTVDYKGVPYYMAQMNEFLRTYAKKFNEIHKSGEDLNGEAGLDFFVGTNKVTGQEYKFGSFGTEGGTGYDPFQFTSLTGSYFEEDMSNTYCSYYHITAENIKINTELLHDAKKFAAASEIENGIGNYDVALELLDLKKDTTMFKQGKPAAFLQTLVAEVGIDTKAALNFSTSQNNLVNAIDNQRLSIGGVDTEEEAMNLMRFQQAYNLSAQVISVMNEIYDKLINYMGV
jgi:flagellar hook-associated protein 1 FlgK